MSQKLKLGHQKTPRIDYKGGRHKWKKEVLRKEGGGVDIKQRKEFCVPITNCSRTLRTWAPLFYTLAIFVPTRLSTLSTNSLSACICTGVPAPRNRRNSRLSTYKHTNKNQSVFLPFDRPQFHTFHGNHRWDGQIVKWGYRSR